jgi:hypothetical protein
VISWFQSLLFKFNLYRYNSVVGVWRMDIYDLNKVDEDAVAAAAAALAAALNATNTTA